MRELSRLRTLRPPQAPAGGNPSRDFMLTMRSSSSWVQPASRARHDAANAKVRDTSSDCRAGVAATSASAAASRRSRVSSLPIHHDRSRRRSEGQVTALSATISSSSTWLDARRRSSIVNRRSEPARVEMMRTSRSEYARSRARSRGDGALTSRLADIKPKVPRRHCRRLSRYIGPESSRILTSFLRRALVHCPAGARFTLRACAFTSALPFRETSRMARRSSTDSRS